MNGKKVADFLHFDPMPEEADPSSGSRRSIRTSFVNPGSDLSDFAGHPRPGKFEEFG